MANSWFNIWHPFLSAAPLTIALIAFLKLISYVLVNGDLRGLHMSGRKWEKSKYMDDDTFDPTSLPYPKNITLGNLLYFIFAPTLVSFLVIVYLNDITDYRMGVQSYQPIYPRNEGIRVLFIVKRTLEFLSALFGMYFLGAQYAGEYFPTR
jgi:diacylglycerol O-acyltransferase-1